ncbi:MAG TPA: hypothetical protein VNK41_07430 [Vicinamibacterales bacterium]|nr:hypothetical protein [Vicinamibacterales bacterium]
MTGEQIVAAIWLGATAVVVLLVVAAYRARKHGTAARAAMGVLWEIHSRDQRRALEIIVERKAESRRPENRDGNLPDLENPSKAP